jgi:hypothetical protein
MPIMADILFFPAGRAVAGAYRPDALQSPAEASVAEPGTDAWFEDEPVAGGSLETVANLAAAPSQSLAGLATKMEVLVGRLAPDDGTDTGLCLAEASLLRSVLRDLRTFAMDAIFAAQGAGLWAPVSTGASLVQGNGAGSCAGDSLAHYQV